MRLYGIGALLKILLGLIIMVILYHYVNVYQDPVIGLSFGFLAVFMIIWGVSYFIFLFAHKLFSSKPPHLHTTLSYKYSLLVGLYVMMNLSLVIMGKWTKITGIALFVGFALLQALFMSDKKKTSYTT